MSKIKKIHVKRRENSHQKYVLGLGLLRHDGNDSVKKTSEKNGKKTRWRSQKTRKKNGNKTAGKVRRPARKPK